MRPAGSLPELQRRAHALVAVFFIWFSAIVEFSAALRAPVKDPQISRELTSFLAFSRVFRNTIFGFLFFLKIFSKIFKNIGESRPSADFPNHHCGISTYVCGNKNTGDTASGIFFYFAPEHPSHFLSEPYTPSGDARTPLAVV